jgi:putative ABC transport system ATP-binding protein
MNLLAELRRSGITVIFVTHEHDIAAFAARRLTLRDGAITGDQRQ